MINELVAQKVNAIAIAGNDFDALQPALKKAMELVKIAYGDDEFQKSVDETEVLIKNYPNLKAIIAPTTVGIMAAA